MAKRKSILSVKEGDVFAVPLKKGLWIACRVLSDTSSDANKRRKKKYSSSDAVRMACCDWFGDRPDHAVDEHRAILKLSHHYYKNQPLAGWCSEDVPSNVKHIGVIPPEDSEARVGTLDCLDWHRLKLEANLQWQWDNDRESLFASEQAEQEQLAREWEEHEAQQRKSLTLEKLSKYRFLPEWESPIPVVAIRKSRKLLRDTAQQLLDLGSQPSVKQRLKVLQTCVEQFNALDAKHGFVGTTEREDICDAFDLIVYACGLTRRKNLADKWRDW